MKKILLNNNHLGVPQLAMGCMRIDSMIDQALETHVKTALELGINHFDHADIYGDGLCEKNFSSVLKTINRDEIIIQSKCGIKQGFYDLSKNHIIKSVDESLQRLGTDYLDILSLHRPDTLMEPEEIAEAFDFLLASGKVRHFGVSNMNASQIKLIKKYVSQPIEFNQLQLSIKRTGMIDSGIHANMKTPHSVDHDDHILEYCRFEDIAIQAWSPFGFGFFEGIFIGNDQFPDLNKCLENLAEKYHTNTSAVAIAWLLRHPVGVQAIIGTTNTERLKKIAEAVNINLTRQEWYEIYRSAGNNLP